MGLEEVCVWRYGKLGTDALLRKRGKISLWKQALLYFNNQVYRRWEVSRGYKAKLPSEPLSWIHGISVSRKTKSKTNFPLHHLQRCTSMGGEVVVHKPHVVYMKLMQIRTEDVILKCEQNQAELLLPADRFLVWLNFFSITYPRSFLFFVFHEPCKCSLISTCWFQYPQAK